MMFDRLKIILFRHFKLIILLNMGLSLFFVKLFYDNGFDQYPLYMLMVFNKALLYVFSFVLEMVIFPKSRAYYFRNMDYSYRKLFGILIQIDWFFLLLFYLTGWLCRNYM
jgi:hypothetical protein